MKNKASAFMEYAIILAVVGAVLITMNIYMKRGVQGRIKDMADNFINAGESAQVVEIDPEVKTTSESNVVSDSTLTDETAIGGGKRTVVVDTTSIEASSVAKDVGRSSTTPDTSSLIPAEEGQVVVPERPEEDTETAEAEVDGIVNGAREDR
jgi:Flp pilus assembly pilin Flp